MRVGFLRLEAAIAGIAPEAAFQRVEFQVEPQIHFAFVSLNALRALKWPQLGVLQRVFSQHVFLFESLATCFAFVTTQLLFPFVRLEVGFQLR